MVIPVLVPAAVLAVETDAARRRWLGALTAAGGAVAATYLLAMVWGLVGVAIEGHSLNYDTGVSSGGQLAAVYVMACCGSLMVSSRRSIVVFGLANAVAVAFLMWMSTEELTSLWCFWAAVASVAIVVHLHGTNGDPQRAAGSRPVTYRPCCSSTRSPEVL